MSADFGELMERCDTISDKIAGLLNRSINNVEIVSARDLEAVGKLYANVLMLQIDLAKQIKAASGSLPTNPWAYPDEEHIKQELATAGNFDNGF